VSDAVKAAESTTSGEIVPVLATTSDNYERSNFLSAMAFAILVTLAAIALFCLPIWPDNMWRTEVLPVPIPLLLLLIAQVIALIVGYRSSRSVAGLHRALTPHATMQQRVDRAAHQAFHQLRMTHTEAATGIMIYVSLFERMVVIVADKAINDRHDAETWNGVRDLLITGLKEGNATQGFVNAVKECGSILKADFPIQPDDTNELANELRLI